MTGSNNVGKQFFSTFVLAVLSACISGCVTTVEGPYQPKVSDDDMVTSYVELALGYLQKADYDAAKRPLKRALKVDAKSPDVHDALALMFQLQGEESLADQHFQVAQQYAPNSARINNNYGSFLYQEKRYSEAYKVLQVAAEDPLYANRGQVFENLGMCALKLNDTQAAFDYFERALKHNSNQVRSMLELAKLQNSLGKHQLANDYYEFYMKNLRANRVRPSASDLLTGVKIAEKLQQNDKVKAYGVVLKKLYPNSSEYQQYQQSYN